MSYKEAASISFNRLPVFAQNVSFVFMAQITVVLAGMLSNIIIVRWLGPEGQGKYVLCVLVATLLFRFASLNISVAATFLVGSKRYSADQVAGNSLSISLTVIAVVAAGYYLLMPALADIFFKNLEPALFTPVFMLFPFALFSSNLIGVSRGLQNIKRSSLIDIVETLSKLVFMVFFVVMLKKAVPGALYGAFAASVLGLLYAVWILPRRISLAPAVDPVVIKDLVGFGIKGHLGNIVQFFNYRLDMLLVNFFLTSASVGIYSVAVMVGELVWYVPTAIASVLLPKIAGSKAEDADVFTPMVSRITVAVTFIFSLALLLIAKKVIGLIFGPKFDLAFMPLALLLPGIVAFSVSKVLASYVVGRGYPAYATYIAGVSLAATVTLDILLIPKYQLPGAALATSLSYVISTLLFLCIAHRISRVPWRDYLIIKRQDILLLTAMVREMKFLAHNDSK